MLNAFSRSEILLKQEGIKKLAESRVAVFGVGGVGGYAAEALARAGVGAIDLIDNDTVNVTNLNRQIIALVSTIGRYKTEVMKERIADINPDCTVTVHNLFFDNSSAHMLDFTQFNYVIDAIDTVSGKLALIELAKKCGVPVISCMGAGNKLNPADFKVADISETSVCPLAKVMRRELKKRDICGVKAVYSEELPKASGEVIGSVSFVPSVSGLIAAGEVIKDLVGFSK